ncbi:hypothetical protein K470DRAFT_266201 [Piedraia hortae CBS 480.64]|uniref:Protein kinase domain-containing protein n=1 Tax=Piedraia hortae CBS 480.64 TaxID=1314780 RepID=A0A6A7BSM6_9PEZI|nr:hypothetical protein K470DRAFT_266201 [Piedraia hortae CBS 480.64]
MMKLAHVWLVAAQLTKRRDRVTHLEGAQSQWYVNVPRSTRGRSGSIVQCAERDDPYGFKLFVRRCAPFSEFVLFEEFHLIESQTRIEHRAVFEGLDILAPTGQWSIKPIAGIIKALKVQHLGDTGFEKARGPSAYLAGREKMTAML